MTKTGATDKTFRDLSNWKGCLPPERVTLKGSRVHVASATIKNTDALFKLISLPGEDAIWTWMPAGPFPDHESFSKAMKSWEKSPDPMHFHILEAKGGQPLGSMSFLNIEPAHGSIEIGFIWFTKPLRRTAAATEALFLMMDYALSSLGYRRLEWKCNKNNENSMRAAKRLGFTFEGIFRNHMVVKGLSRDSAWFSILDHEWPALRNAYLQWLSPDNFDGDGQQKASLSALIREAKA